MIDINQDRSERVKYDYPDFPVYIRRDFLSVFPNYAADSHWHDDIELIAILSGHMLYNINGQIIRMEAGEGVLVNARQFHYGFSDDRTECDFICILFHPMLLCGSKTFEQDFVLPFLKNGDPFVFLSPSLDWQKQLLTLICNMAEERIATTPLYIQGALSLLWNALVTHTDTGEHRQPKNNAALSTLKTMISFIHEHYTEKITLADIAASGHVSKRTCGTLFANYQNKTPIGFLTEYRLRKSIELMKTTDMTILELSLASGFSGASYYAETFRKYFGKSPAEYKKQTGI